MVDLKRTEPRVVIGLDLSDKTAHVWALDFETGEMLEDGKVAMQRGLLARRFSAYEGARVVIEAGTQSRWVAEELEDAGCEVLVANPRRVKLISESRRKTDRIDAELLARLGRSDPELLSPIKHRGRQAQQDLTILRARDVLVRMRTTLVNHVRSIVKVFGHRLPKKDAHGFHRFAADELPEELRETLLPLLAQIESSTKAIKGYDRRVERVAKERYPETEALRQIKGVGPLTAMGFVLTLEDPNRFKSGRAVGSFLGLCPRLDESGESSPQRRITKSGDSYVRRLLVGSAHYVLGPHGPDTDLRRWGLRLAERGGKNGKKRAAVAVARKLAVLLHRLWLTREPYVPLRNEADTQGTVTVAPAQGAA